MVRKRAVERRKKQRVKLSQGLIARFGTTGAVILDITDSGARIEHFTNLPVNRKARFRFQWQQAEIEAEAVVRSCRIHRFAAGDDGMTVYQSGLQFTGFIGPSDQTLRDMVATIVARSLAEQVANARGIGPVVERTMPVFRGGMVGTAEGDEPRLSATEMVVERGYTRCRLLPDRGWELKWSRTAEQPIDGFTVAASETHEHLAQLCDTYLHATDEERRLIRLMAAASVERYDGIREPR